MNPEAMFSAAAAGLVSSGVSLLTAFAVALVYEHGRYLPLWLPDLGLAGAYLFHALWSGGWSPVLAAPAALVVTVALAWSVHSSLMARFIDRGDLLRPLLIGLGLTLVFQGLASLYGEGMSQHYPTTPFARETFSERLGFPVRWADLACLAAAPLVLLGTEAFLRFTRTGLRVRAVNANRDWARSLGIPVARVDAVVVGVAAVLVFVGVVLRAMRYDLQPAMMTYPGLAVVAACVTAGPGRRAAALAIALGLEVLAGVAGSSPTTSPLQRSIPFTVLVLVLLWRANRAARA